jgi:hypothetical protein
VRLYLPPVTFETPENFCTESNLFDVAEVNLHFNVILGRLTLYQFMAVTHYGFLVLKMPSPSSVLKIHEEGVSALEKLQPLAPSCEATAGPSGQDMTPLSSHQRGLASAPRMQLSDNEGVPVKTIHIEADAAQTIRIAGDLDSKEELTLITFLWANVNMFA